MIAGESLAELDCRVSPGFPGSAQPEKSYSLLRDEPKYQ
jgi:hypothetical protein